MPRKSASAPKPVQPDLLGGVVRPEPKPTKTKDRAAAAPAVASEPVRKQQAVATIGPVNPRNMLAVILQAAADPKVDVPKMQALLAMQKEMVAEQSRLDFIQAFYELKKELPRINKEGRIEILEKGQDGKRVAGRDRVQQATPYATYDNIRDAVDPILERHNFTMWDETEPSPDGSRLHVITHLDHNNGYGRRSIFPLPAEVSGSKNNVQGWGSSNSYGKRYGALNLLNLRTKAPEDRDLDGNKPKLTKGGKPQVIDGDVVIDGGVVQDVVPRITTEQCDKLIEAIEACGATRKQFCEAWRIEKVEDLASEHFDQALRACIKKAKERG